VDIINYDCLGGSLWRKKPLPPLQVKWSFPKKTDVAVMDFSKAFDEVDQQRLILKLKRMDIINKTSNWIGHGYHIDFKGW
jgi:hypothetical protein